MLCWHKLTLSLTVEATELFEVRWKQLIFSFPFRMWRNEVNMRKRERTRQQAEELRKMQKLFLLKAMSSPGRAGDCIARFDCSVLTGKVVAEQPDLCGDSSGHQSKPASRLHTTTSKLYSSTAPQLTSCTPSVYLTSAL